MEYYREKKKKTSQKKKLDYFGIYLIIKIANPSLT